jgi:hypothetical protein
VQVKFQQALLVLSIALGDYCDNAPPRTGAAPPRAFDPRHLLCLAHTARCLQVNGVL